MMPPIPPQTADPVSPSSREAQLTATGPATTEPQCAECEALLVPTNRSVLLPALGETLVWLRCPQCKTDTYWRPATAYVPIAQNVEWVR